MKHACILAAFAAVFAAAPARAQPVAADLLPAYEVATIVTSMGMRPVGRPAWMRGRYVVAAIDSHGREVNVVIDAFDGQVIAVRPLGRNSFGAPPPGPGPGAPPPGGEQFFDHDRQQGARPPAPAARAPRDPSATGNVALGAPAERGETVKRQSWRNSTPLPRPRPALAKANDPGSVPAQPEVIATPDQTKPASAGDAAAKDAAVKGNVAKPDAAKPVTAARPAAAQAKAEARPDAKPLTGQQAAKPRSAKAAAPSKPEVASKPEAGQQDIRVIDLSKPKDARKPEDKPGEAIRF